MEECTLRSPDFWFKLSVITVA